MTKEQDLRSMSDMVRRVIDRIHDFGFDPTKWLSGKGQVAIRWADLDGWTPMKFESNNIVVDHRMVFELPRIQQEERQPVWLLFSTKPVNAMFGRSEDIGAFGPISKGELHRLLCPDQRLMKVRQMLESLGGSDSSALSETQLMGMVARLLGEYYLRMVVTCSDSSWLAAARDEPSVRIIVAGIINFFCSLFSPPGHTVSADVWKRYRDDRGGQQWLEGNASYWLVLPLMNGFREEAITWLVSNKPEPDVGILPEYIMKGFEELSEKPY